MAIQLNCTICLAPLEEGDLTHIPHTDGTPVNGRHIGDGIHPACLREWVIHRFVADQLITCPLGCPDKLIDAQAVLSRRELQNRIPRQFANRARNWVVERIAHPMNRQIFLFTGATGALTGAISQLGTNVMTSLVRSMAGQGISSSVVFITGTGASFAISAIMAGAAAMALSGQGEMGLRNMGIMELSIVVVVVTPILGIAATQSLLS